MDDLTAGRRSTWGERQRDRVEPVRSAQWAEVERAARERGDDVVAQVQHITSQVDDIDAVHPAIYQALHEDIRAAMVDLGHDASVIDEVAVGSMMAEDVTAQIQRGPDGSAVVSVSDGIHGLINTYARHVAQRAVTLMRGSMMQRMRSLTRMWRAGDLQLDHKLLAGCLRYNNIHRRIFANNGSITLLLDEEQEAVSTSLSRYGLTFIVAHEVAHHVLGHLSEWGGHRRSRWTHSDRQAEIDADRLAFQTTLRVGERSRSSGLGAPIMGAMIAIACLRCAERALFVRCGASHPAAESRAELILDTLPAHVREAMRYLMASLIEATDTAAIFAPDAPRVDWDYTYGHPSTQARHTAQYLKMIGDMDRLQSAAVDVAADRIRQLDEREGLTGYDAVRAALDGQLPEAFALWGLPDPEIATSLDPAEPLTYHTLQENLFKNIPGVTRVDPTVRLIYAILSATIVARVMVVD